VSNISASCYREPALALQHWLQLTQTHGSLIRAFTGGARIEAHAHYPTGDLIDSPSGTQCYYHCHRGDEEHGHLHLFRRIHPGGPLSHLIAISLDARGLPIEFFTVNRWVTEDHWVSAFQALQLISEISLQEAACDANVSKWLIRFLRFYQPVLHQLLLQRDQRLVQSGLPIAEALADKSLQVLSRISIDWAKDLALIDRQQSSVLQTKQGP